MTLTKRFRRGRVVASVTDTESAELFKKARGVLSLRQVAYFAKENGHPMSYEKWRKIERGEWLPSLEDVAAAASLPNAPDREALIVAATHDRERRIAAQYAGAPAS